MLILSAQEKNSNLNFMSYIDFQASEILILFGNIYCVETILQNAKKCKKMQKNVANIFFFRVFEPPLWIY